MKGEEMGCRRRGGRVKDEEKGGEGEEKWVAEEEDKERGEDK